MPTHVRVTTIVIASSAAADAFPVVNTNTAAVATQAATGSNGNYSQVENVSATGIDRATLSHQSIDPRQWKAASCISQRERRIHRFNLHTGSNIGTIIANNDHDVTTFANVNPQPQDTTKTAAVCDVDVLAESSSFSQENIPALLGCDNDNKYDSSSHEVTKSEGKEEPSELSKDALIGAFLSRRKLSPPSRDTFIGVEAGGVHNSHLEDSQKARGHDDNVPPGYNICNTRMEQQKCIAKFDTIFARRRKKRSKTEVREQTQITDKAPSKEPLPTRQSTRLKNKTPEKSVEVKEKKEVVPFLTRRGKSQSSSPSIRHSDSLSQGYSGLDPTNKSIRSEIEARVQTQIEEVASKEPLPTHRSTRVKNKTPEKVVVKEKKEAVPPKRHEHGWDHYYSRLKAYKNLFGMDADVPRGHVLHTWIEEQRANVEFVPPYRVIWLQRLGIEFEPMFKKRLTSMSQQSYSDFEGNLSDETDTEAGEQVQVNLASTGWAANLRTTPKNLKEKEAESESSHELSIDTKRADAASARAERARKRQAQLAELPDEAPPKKRSATTPPDQPSTAPKKANYTEDEIKAAGLLLNQPCTIIEGRLTSGFITLTLPPMPAKLGLIIKNNLEFGYPEVKCVLNTSPIAIQIPVDFRKDCFITSIESPSLGYINPESATHCVDLFNQARQGEKGMLVVNFAKNPTALYTFPDDPSEVDQEEKQCSGPCGSRMTRTAYSGCQWHKKTGLCMECMTVKDILGKKHFETYMAQNPPPKEIRRKEPPLLPLSPSNAEESTLQEDQDPSPLPRKRPRQKWKSCTKCGLEKDINKFTATQWHAPWTRVCEVCMYKKSKDSVEVSADQRKAQLAASPEEEPHPAMPNASTTSQKKESDEALTGGFTSSKNAKKRRRQSSSPLATTKKCPECGVEKRSKRQVCSACRYKQSFTRKKCNECNMEKNMGDYIESHWWAPLIRICVVCMYKKSRENSVEASIDQKKAQLAASPEKKSHSAMPDAPTTLQRKEPDGALATTVRRKEPDVALIRGSKSFQDAKNTCQSSSSPLATTKKCPECEVEKHTENYAPWQKICSECVSKTKKCSECGVEKPTQEYVPKQKICSACMFKINNNYSYAMRDFHMRQLFWGASMQGYSVPNMTTFQQHQMPFGVPTQGFPMLNRTLQTMYPTMPHVAMPRPTPPNATYASSRRQSKPASAKPISMLAELLPCNGARGKEKVKDEYSARRQSKPASVEPIRVPPERKQCNGACGKMKVKDKYSGSQWNKARTKERICLQCMEATPTSAKPITEPPERKQCNGACGKEKVKDEYSISQWNKGRTKERTCLQCMEATFTHRT